MTDEQTPLEDVTPPSDDHDPDEDSDEDFGVEPLNAHRSSPYAIAAFVASVIAIFQLPQNGFFFGAPLRFSIALIPTAAVALIALWLSRQAEREIFEANGVLGGVGFYRAAAVIASVCLAFLALTVLFILLDVTGIVRWTDF